MRELLFGAWLVVMVAWRTGPLAVIFTSGEVVSTALRFLQPIMVALVIDGIVNHSITQALWGVALLVASLAFGGALEALAVGYRVKLISDIGYAFDKEILHSLTRITALDDLEHPRLAKAVAKVKERADTMGFCFNGLMTVVIQAAAPITTICVAVVVDPRLLILAVAGIPSILVASRVAARQAEADDASQADASRAIAWAELVPAPDARAERKVFRIWDWYRHNIRTAVGRRDAAFFTAARIEGVSSFLAELFYLACVAAILIWILGSGGMSAGAVAAALLVSLDLKGTIEVLRAALSRFGPALRSAAAMRDVHVAATSATAAASDTPRHSDVCRLESVSYTHAGADRPALQCVDVTIEPGSVVAVVGANGAGKSTLTEVLLQLRRPTTGQAQSPSGASSMIAQNYGRYQFPLAESVALTDMDDLGPTESDRVRSSLREASSRRFWEEHDADIGLQLGPDWPNSTDLSIGQWQAVAAARCFYIDDAQFVVLDEPTAALDPEAQEAMTTRYMNVARRVANQGGIAVLVTHRMSMPMLADRILVMHDGEVAESGTHAELIAAQGRYARTYEAAVSGFLQLAREDSPTS